MASANKVFYSPCEQYDLQYGIESIAKLCGIKTHLTYLCVQTFGSDHHYVIQWSTD